MPMNTYRIFLLLLFIRTGTFASAQQPAAWELKKDEAGIKIYSRAGDSSKFNDLKVETTVEGRLSSLAALLLDIANYPRWSFNSKKASVLKTVGPSELYFYSLV